MLEDQIISIILLIVAVIALGFASWQTLLAKRALYGQIYKIPPLERVGFLKLEAKYNNRVHFNKPIGGDIFEEVALPTNSRTPVLITWRNTEKQSLRHVQFGFELGYKKRPRVVRRLSGWVAKEIKPLKMAEYIDLDGYYHIEYPTPRKFGKGSPFISEFEIETGSAGGYNLRVAIYSSEAREPLEKKLKVIVK
jgi:hypothetical protein